MLRGGFDSLLDHIDVGLPCRNTLRRLFLECVKYIYRFGESHRINGAECTPLKVRNHFQYACAGKSLLMALL